MQEIKDTAWSLSSGESSWIPSRVKTSRESPCEQRNQEESRAKVQKEHNVHFDRIQSISRRADDGREESRRRQERRRYAHVVNLFWRGPSSKQRATNFFFCCSSNFQGLRDVGSLCSSLLPQVSCELEVHTSSPLR